MLLAISKFINITSSWTIFIFAIIGAPITIYYFYPFIYMFITGKSKYEFKNSKRSKLYEKIESFFHIILFILLSSILIFFISGFFYIVLV